MRKLFLILMVMAIIFLVGCQPKPPDPPVVAEIVCTGGNYKVFYSEWTMTGCVGDEQVKGTYWENLNGRMFLLGDPVKWNPYGDMQADIKKVYGECPKSFIKEVEMKKEYLEEVSKSLK